MIVLDEDLMNTRFRQLGLMIAFEKKSPGVLAYLRPDETNAWDFRLSYLQSAPAGGAQAVTVFMDLSRLV